MRFLDFLLLRKAALPTRLRPEELRPSAAVSPMARASWQQHAFDLRSPWSRVPLTANLKLYEELAEAIPIIGAALVRLTQLVGCPRVEMEDDDEETEVHDWMDGLHVNRVATGLDNWFSGWCIDHLLYGRSHAEILPLRDYSDIWGLQTLHPRTIELRPAPDGYGIQLVQRQGFGREVVLNQQLLLSAFHDLRTDDPNGNSLLWGLPLVTRVYQQMVNSLGSTWERFGTPLYHISIEPPEGFSDPDGSEGATIAEAHAAKLQAVMQSRAEGNTRDFSTFGKVVVTVIGAEGEALDFTESARTLLEDIVGRTGLPSWMLGRHWSTTERMSSVEAAIVGEVIDEIRGHLMPPLHYLIDLRQRMVGGDTEFKLTWDAPSLIDRKAEAEAERTEAEAQTKKLEILQKLWRLGMFTNLEVAREMRPELADLSDEQLQTRLPELATEPPEPMQIPGAGGGAGDNGERPGEELPRPGPFGRSVEVGNGRH